MNIHKSHSKNDLIDLINLIELKVVFSHQDNKKDIQEKILEVLKTNIEIKDNYYNIQNKEGLKIFLANKNPKKTLTIKEKNDVMTIAKHIINYSKNNFDLDSSSKYTYHQEIQDDMDYIKQFGDIPSVRRCCRLLQGDPQFACRPFKPLISPQVQKTLDDKKVIKKTYHIPLKIKYATPDDPIVVYFD